MTCDNCERECDDCCGDPDQAVFCCRCQELSYRENAGWKLELCEKCEERPAPRDVDDAGEWDGSYDRGGRLPTAEDFTR